MYRFGLATFILNLFTGMFLAVVLAALQLPPAATMPTWLPFSFGQNLIAGMAMSLLLWVFATWAAGHVLGWLLPSLGRVDMPKVSALTEDIFIHLLRWLIGFLTIGVTVMVTPLMQSRPAKTLLAWLVMGVITLVWAAATHAVARQQAANRTRRHEDAVRLGANRP